MTTTFILNNWSWSQAEVETLITEGYAAICDKVNHLDQHTFDKVFEYFDRWLNREISKAKLNYWLKKSGLTLEEVNIWMTI